jgi:hypothetical protein
MSIEVKCSGCAQILRVQDQDAGKQGRCPKCQTTFTIPSAGSSSAGPNSGSIESKPESPFPQQQAPFGQQPQTPYGQQPQTPFGQQGQNPFSDKPATPTQNPYATPQQFAPAPGRRPGQPHRGGTILTLGLLGLFCCGFLGIAAWVMGNEDLQKMNRGIMDPSGRGTTQAGRIIGIIAIVKMGIGVFVTMAAR